MEKKLTFIIDLCTTCINACNTYITDSMHYKDLLKRFDIIRQLRDTVDTCMLTLSLVNRQSPYAEEMCKICAHVCSKSAKMCEIYDNESAKKCAETCRKVADACHSFQPSTAMS